MRYLAIFLFKVVQTAIWGIKCIIVTCLVIMSNALMVIWYFDLKHFFVFDPEDYYYNINDCNRNRWGNIWVVRSDGIQEYKHYYKTPKNLWLGHRTLEFRGKKLTFKNH